MILIYSPEVADRALERFVAKMIGFAGLDTWTLLSSMERDDRWGGIPIDMALWFDWLESLWAAAGFSYSSSLSSEETPFIQVRVDGAEYLVQLVDGKESVWPPEAAAVSSRDGESEGFYYDAIVRRLRTALEDDPDSEDKRVLLTLKGQWRRDDRPADSVDPPSDSSEPSGRLFAHREGPDD